MDTISIYAVAPLFAKETGEKVNYIYFGTVSDSENEGSENWEIDLIEIINIDSKQPHDELVEYMAGQVIPKLYNDSMIK
ncbi:MAG: hypothetical protein LH478_01055 [Chitinophagaceae bacterium]|nr:hypothetical protein [Chitinophagaceae bacterium]